MSLNVVSCNLEPCAEYAYWITAKRYTPPKPSEEGITLICAHATGMPKECWEPVLRRLFSQDNQNRIREVYSIECINHGEAAVLNQTRLLTDFLDQFTWDNYGRAIARYLSAGSAATSGARVDFSKRTLVGLGHSMGAVSMAWMQNQQPPLCPRFHSIILCEPMLNPPGHNLGAGGASMFTTFTYQRRDIWPSRRAAMDDLIKNKGYKDWDPEQIEIFVKYALRDHFSKDFLVMPYTGVALACSRNHEAACYRDPQTPTEMALALPSISRQTTGGGIHLVWGEKVDIVPQPIRTALQLDCDIKWSSVHAVSNAAHLVVQHSPEGVAKVISRILSKVGSFSAVPPSKL